MKKQKRSKKARVGVRLTAVIILVVVSAWLIAVLFGRPHVPVEAAAAADGAAIARGEYLARMGNCVTCHSAPGGKPFAGGLPMGTPIGVLYTSNITPDPATGIGTYSLADFDRAVRYGVRKDGAAEYPAMPYPSYARITDADLHDLYAYFMRGVAPVKQANRPSTIPWPLGMRWPMTWWRWLFAPGVHAFVPAAGEAPDVARGAYLVEGLGHCGACHTPRALTMQEEGLTPTDSRHYLAGSSQPVDGWIATNLHNDIADGLGSWSRSDIEQLLKTGRNGHATVFGNMSDVITNSTQYLTETDLQGIAAFLKSLPATMAPRPSASVHEAAKANAPSAKGAALYVTHCAACHGAEGAGMPGLFPALAGNPVLDSPNPASLTHVILSGSTPAATNRGAPSVPMPGYASQLSNKQIADIVNYMRARWSHAGETDVKAVAHLRDEMKAPLTDTSSAR